MSAATCKPAALDLERSDLKLSFVATESHTGKFLVTLHEVDMLTVGKVKTLLCFSR